MSRRLTDRFVGGGEVEMSSSDEFDDEKKYIMEWDAVDCVEEIEKDGNCLFRCLALSALGQVAKHPKVRDDIATELKENEEVWKKNRNVYNEAGTFELTHISPRRHMHIMYTVYHKTRLHWILGACM